MPVYCTTPREAFRVAPGSRTLVSWFEKPESCFRFVGATSDIARREGWYLRHWQTIGFYVNSDTGETCRPVVYQMVAKRGATRYLAGISDAYNGNDDGSGPAMLCLDTVYTELRDAANEALRIAELYADEAREYDEAWSDGSLAADYQREAIDHRRRFLETALELRQLRKVVYPSQFPSVCAEMRATMRAILDDMREAREKVAELREKWRWRKDAFNEGFGA